MSVKLLLILVIESQHRSILGSRGGAGGAGMDLGGEHEGTRIPVGQKVKSAGDL